VPRRTSSGSVSKGVDESRGDGADGALERARENPVASKPSRFHLVSISLPSRFHLVFISLPSRLHLTSISFASHFHLIFTSLPSRFHLTSISFSPRFYLIFISFSSPFHLVATSHILYYMLPLPSVHLVPKCRSNHSQRGLQASAKGLGSMSLPTSGPVQSFRFARCLAGSRVGSRG